MNKYRHLPFELKLVAYTFLVMGLWIFINALYGLFIMKPNVVNMNAYIGYFIGLVCFAAYQYLLQLNKYWRRLSVILLKGMNILLFLISVMAFIVYWIVLFEGNSVLLIPFILLLYYLIIRLFMYYISILERDEIRALFDDRRIRSEIDIINESIHDGMSNKVVMKLNRQMHL